MKTPHIIIPAIGETYTNEARRLTQTFPDAQVISAEHPLYRRLHDHDHTNGLLVKADFAKYLAADYVGPVLLCDADLHSDNKQPLAAFPGITADLACVPYRGHRYMPDPSADRILHKNDRKLLNTGLVFFRTADLARTLSQRWVARYQERLADPSASWAIRRREMDEVAFLLAIQDLGLSVHHLGSEWNDWEGRSAVPVFKHSHFSPGL